MALTHFSKSSMLTTLLPSGDSFWIALFTENPTELPPTEVDDDDYVRVEWTDWINIIDGTSLYRVNDGDIEFPAAADTVTGIVGWGIYDADTEGNLLAWGPVLDSGGNQVSRNLDAGDVPRFVSQDLKVGLVDG